MLILGRWRKALHGEEDLRWRATKQGRFYHLVVPTTRTLLIRYLMQKCLGIRVRPLKQQSHEAIYWRKGQIVRSLGLLAIGGNRFINKDVDPYNRTVSDQFFWVSNILEVVQRRNYRVELDRSRSGLPFFERRQRRRMSCPYPSFE
jgi:hypothetical protein